MFLSIIITLSFFIFILRPVNSFGEPRWYFPLLLATFICISKSSIFLYNFVRKYNKFIAIIFLVALIGFGGYSQIQHADAIIKIKKDSYQGTKKAGIFLKEILNKNEIVIAKPVTQISYYSEGNVIQPMPFAQWNNGSAVEMPIAPFLEKIKENANAKYILVSFSQPNHPEWMQKIDYAVNQQGQTVMALWRIPFMNTTIDIRTGQQDIKQEAVYEDYGVKFKLLTIQEDVFIYKIERI
jgi:hypothetical protein